MILSMRKVTYELPSELRLDYQGRGLTFEIARVTIAGFVDSSLRAQKDWPYPLFLLDEQEAAERSQASTTETRHYWRIVDGLLTNQPSSLSRIVFNRKQLASDSAFIKGLTSSYRVPAYVWETALPYDQKSFAYAVPRTCE